MIGALATAILTLPALVALAVHRYGQRTHPAPPAARTAVVLGARVHPDGSLSPALVDRVRAGARLVHEGKASRLILSGGSPDGRPTEARAMAALAGELGVAREQLVLEEASRSTFENAARCRPLLGDETEILLVTCDFHLARAVAHFRTHRLTVWPVASRRTLSAADRLMVTLREMIGLLARPGLLLALAGMPRPPR